MRIRIDFVVMCSPYNVTESDLRQQSPRDMRLLRRKNKSAPRNDHIHLYFFAAQARPFRGNVGAQYFRCAAAAQQETRVAIVAVSVVFHGKTVLP